MTRNHRLGTSCAGGAARKLRRSRGLTCSHAGATATGARCSCSCSLRDSGVARSCRTKWVCRGCRSGQDLNRIRSAGCTEQTHPANQWQCTSHLRLAQHLLRQPSSPASGASGIGSGHGKQGNAPSPPWLLEHRNHTGLHYGFQGMARPEQSEFLVVLSLELAVLRGGGVEG